MYQLYPFLDLSCQEIYVWNYSDENFVEDLFLIDFKSLNLETQSNCNLGPNTNREALCSDRVSPVPRKDRVATN